ncbi:hypothetical protein M5K25_011517 [Dendrobium thyrsiflorum]|uniref:Uncharacterized protein n=1 Tax=Dendrobium thyrsiflorum TaxID=117978 RepID=A0ABD0VAL5_DENTH
MGRRSWWLLMAILTVTMALLHLTLFTLSSSSSHGLQRQDMESSEQNKHQPWILSPDVESARQVPTGPDPIHHNQAPPFHHFR